MTVGQQIISIFFLYSVMLFVFAGIYYNFYKKNHSVFYFNSEILNSQHNDKINAIEIKLATQLSRREIINYIYYDLKQQNKVPEFDKKTNSIRFGLGERRYSFSVAWNDNGGLGLTSEGICIVYTERQGDHLKSFEHFLVPATYFEKSADGNKSKSNSELPNSIEDFIEMAQLVRTEHDERVQKS
ncbi:MAG TPA: hypothetical protein VLX29_00080 [Nitrospirota bacterium]|nr:hypothetical protein [Nitrospirota bacterium]